MVFSIIRKLKGSVLGETGLYKLYTTVYTVTIILMPAKNILTTTGYTKKVNEYKTRTEKFEFSKKKNLQLSCFHKIMVSSFIFVPSARLPTVSVSHMPFGEWHPPSLEK